MEISKSIEQAYLHPMAIAQLAADYSRLGYAVTKEEPVGPYYADLVARKGNETIIFEVKTGRMSRELRQKLAAFSNYVKQTPNHTFRVVFATPPQTKIIEVANLETLIADYFIHHEMPEALQELSSYSLIDDVSDVEISRLAVSKLGELIISGTGTIGVTLRYGGSSDGVEMADAYPFDFEVIMTYESNSWQISEFIRCNVDTSSFFE